MACIRIKRRTKVDLGWEWVRNHVGELSPDKEDAHCFDTVEQATNLCLKKARETRKNRTVWEVVND